MPLGLLADSAPGLRLRRLQPDVDHADFVRIDPSPFAGRLERVDQRVAVVGQHRPADVVALHFAVERRQVAMDDCLVILDESVAVDFGSAVDIRLDAGKDQRASERIFVEDRLAPRPAGTAAIRERGLARPSGGVIGASRA